MRRGHIIVYIMANKRHGTLYIGVSSDGIRRIHEHRTHAIEGFTKRYGLTKLVYYELLESMIDAIHREKRLKKYTRAAKITLIESRNPDWSDLWTEITG